MITIIFETIKEAIYLNTLLSSDFISVLIRSALMYFFGITLARFNKKLIGIRTPFNFILFVMLGALGANAILYKKFFFLVICAITFLTLLNGFITMLAFHFKSIENLVKGDQPELIKNGKIQWKAMQKNYITKKELLNELQTQLHTTKFDHVISAHLASDGSINFITKE